MQKFNNFYNKGFALFTKFTGKVGPINNLIHNNDISVIILTIFTIRLTKTQ